ncbi:MAG: DUF3822 family protein, partial [Flavitalea sp.]
QLNSILLMEVSEKLFGYVVFNKEQNQFLGLRQYHLDTSSEQPPAQVLNEIITNDPLLRQSWKEFVAIYSFPDSTLLPEKYFDIGMNKTFTDLLFGHAFRGTILSEKIPAWEVYNIYRIQRDIHGLMQQKFAGGRYWHYNSILLSSIERTQEAGVHSLKCIFYPEKFVVAFLRGPQLQLLQTYQYETPEDVSYFLLKICRQFEASQEHVKVNVGGLIEQQSTLYTELLKYFQHIECDKIPATIQTQGLLENFPEHYFSQLLKMATCV